MKYIKDLFTSHQPPQPTFVELVKNYFSFLQEDFGFSISIVRKKSSDDPFEDGLVEYRTLKTVITVDLEHRGGVIVDLGPVNEPFVAQTSLFTVIEFLSEEKDKDLLSLRQSPSGNWNFRVEQQIIQAADVLRRYSHQLFSDSFLWMELLKYSLEKTQRWYRHIPDPNLRESELERYLKSKMENKPPG